MEIKVISNMDEEFKRVCDWVERRVTRENLLEYGGTLRYKNLTYNSDLLIVAYENGLPIGYNSVLFINRGIYIYQIAVKNGYKNKRIGSALLEEAIGFAKQFGLEVCSSIYEDNEYYNKLLLGHGFEMFDEDYDIGNDLLVLKTAKTKILSTYND